MVFKRSTPIKQEIEPETPLHVDGLIRNDISPASATDVIWALPRAEMYTLLSKDRE